MKNEKNNNQKSAEEYLLEAILAEDDRDAVQCALDEIKQNIADIEWYLYGKDRRRRERKAK